MERPMGRPTTGGPENAGNPVFRAASGVNAWCVGGAARNYVRLRPFIYRCRFSVGEKKDKQKVQGKQKKEKHFPNVESRFGNRTDVTHTSSALVPCCCVKGLQDEVAHIMHAPRIVLFGYVLLCVPHPDRVCFLTRNTAPSVWLEW